MPAEDGKKGLLGLFDDGSLLNSSADRMAAVDNNGVITLWNNESERQTGILRESALGRYVRDVFPETERIIVSDAVRNCLDGGTQPVVEIETKPGKCVELLVNAVHNNSGVITGALITLRDVSRHKRVESELREGENRFRDLFENASDLVQFIALDERVMFVNRAWLEALDYDEATARDLSLADFIHPDSLATYREIRKRVIDGERVVNFQTRYRTRHGETIVLEGNVDCKKQKDQPLYTRGIFRNVTQRQVAQLQLENFMQRLTDSEQQVQTIFNQAPDPVIVIDTMGLVMRWNPRAEAMFGWRANEVTGKPLHEFIIPERFREAHVQGMRRFRETGEGPVLNTTIEIHALHSDGHEFDVDLSISPMAVKDRTYFIGFIRDITHRKKHEAQLLALNSELQRSNDYLQSFAYVASHDMKEPLRKIQLLSERVADLDRERLSERGADLLERVRSSAARMNELIDDLLLFSRMSAGEHHFETTDLAEILEQVKGDLATMLEAKNATVVADGLPVARLVPVQFRQLFQNIITNAMKFSKPEEPPVVRITCRAVPPGQRPFPAAEAMAQYAELVFTDNGIGFDPAYAERIFELFQRLHNKDAYPGTGIGLALCRKVAENHGGTMSATGTPGSGATFTIYFRTDL